MKRLILCLVTVAGLVGPAPAQLLQQIMVRAEFVSVPKALFDRAAQAQPDRLPSVKLLLGFKESGQATVVSCPTVLTLDGVEAIVKAVTYPTRLGARIPAAHSTSEADAAAVVEQTGLTTGTVGVTFSVLPEIARETEEIGLTFAAELVDLPVWQKYGVKCTNTLGHTQNVDLDEPFFHRRSVNSSVVIKNGATVLASGGMSDLENNHLTFLLLTAKFVDSAGKECEVWLPPHLCYLSVEQMLTQPMAEPIVELRVVDKSRKPVLTAEAYPDAVLMGAAYDADEHGRIRLTAVPGRVINVWAVGYEDSEIPVATWQTNRFPVVTLRSKSEERPRNVEPRVP